MGNFNTIYLINHVLFYVKCIFEMIFTNYFHYYCCFLINIIYFGFFKNIFSKNFKLYENYYLLKRLIYKNKCRRVIYSTYSQK